MQDSLSFSAGAIGDEQRKVEVKGTFNALAARGLGADSLADAWPQVIDESGMQALETGFAQASKFAMKAAAAAGIDLS